MKPYQNVSLVNLPLSPYDIVAVLKDTDEKENIIRAQVKDGKQRCEVHGRHPWRCGQDLQVRR